MILKPKKLLSIAVSLCLTMPAWSQTDEQSDDAPARENLLEEIVVVGSQIRGANIEGALPVSVLATEDIELTAATSGDELLRAIPQVGETNFNESVTTGVNAARGDVGSINLRGLGTGNTLVLINGRRMVLHPGTQTENLVPVVTANSNTLPVLGIERVEVLRDGAAAIYGTDAVAGVINYVLNKDYEGGELNVQFGAEEGTGRDEINITGAKGFSFNGGKTYLTVTGAYADRSGIMASERSFSENADLRPRVEGDPLFEGDTQLDGRSTSTPWGIFEFDGGPGRAHLQPSTFSSCDFSVSPDLCLDASSSTVGDRDLRLNRNAARTLISDRERLNLFAFLNHDFDNGMEFFGEVGYYEATTNRVWEQAGILSNGRMEVPAHYYWNPFGPVTFADGRPNPNRLPGLDPEVVPEEGLSFRLRSYRPLDTGPRRVEVRNESYRFVGGLAGTFGEQWDWESAIVYSEAKTKDHTENRVSTSLFQQSLLLDTPEAYNLFTGGDINNPSNPMDPTLNPQSVIDPFLIDVDRISKTSLTLADFKLSNANLFSLPAGDVAIGAGIEWREEDFDENRDPRSDGTISFTDAVTGELVNVSDIMGSSASPDADGSRRVWSAYAEFLVPLLRDAPLVRSLDAQLAVRFEDFSDVGSVTKPKIALSWYPFEQFQIRAAYSEGFRAPNLVQIHQGQLSVVNTRSDPARRDPITGDIPSGQVQEIREGNRELEPEESENFTFGFVYTPFNSLTITADAWRIDQDGVVGILGGANHILLDDVLRQQGSFNPAVIREPTADGSLGEVEVVFDRYINFQPRKIKGYDFGILYGVDTDAGEFDFKFNMARLTTFNQEAGPLTQLLVDAGVPAQNTGSLVEQEFRPKWRGTASLRWRKDAWGAGIFATYVSEVFDIQTRADSDTTDPGAPLPVDEYFRVNVHADYEFRPGFVESAQVRLGVRNVFDEKPPLADEAFGYEGSLHPSSGRYPYINVRMKF